MCHHFDSAIYIFPKLQSILKSGNQPFGLKRLINCMNHILFHNINSEREVCCFLNILALNKATSIITKWNNQIWTSEGQLDTRKHPFWNYITQVRFALVIGVSCSLAEVLSFQFLIYFEVVKRTAWIYRRKKNGFQEFKNHPDFTIANKKSG
jgi:hypothetical protein